MTTLFLVATEDMIDKQPEKLRAIMAAHKEAVDYIYAHPKEAADLAAKRMVGVDRAVVERAVERLAKVRYWSDGGFDPQAIGTLEEVLQLTGEAKGPVDLKAMSDQRFLPEGAAHLQ